MNLSAILLLISLTTIFRAEAAAVPGEVIATKNKRDIWQPAVGSGWQIVLNKPLDSTSPNVPTYDIDLFDNPSNTISTLHGLGRKVICYFSAGTFENWRRDASSFTTSDYGNALSCPDDPNTCNGEWWLDTRSVNVRNIMEARLDLAVSSGCDGVDPDNIDGYENDTGFPLTTADGVNYVTFLANAAHARGLSIGLKNGNAIVSEVLSLMQWEINEECETFGECDAFQPFITANKPVFHIEYTDSDPPSVDQATNDRICNDPTAARFSTIIKDRDLDDWVVAC